MDLDDNSKKKHNSLLKSFSFAFFGIRTAVLEERNMRIHLVLSVLVIVLSFLFSISLMEWIVVFLLIGGMLSLELVNSAIERIVDLVTTEYHPLAKKAKDLAAGAALVYAIIAVIIGAILFVPHILDYFENLKK